MRDYQKKLYQSYAQTAKDLIDPERIGPAGMLLEVPQTIAMDSAFREPYVQGYRHAFADLARRLKVSSSPNVQMVDDGAFVDLVIWIPREVPRVCATCGTSLPHPVYLGDGHGTCKVMR